MMIIQNFTLEQICKDSFNKLSTHDYSRPLNVSTGRDLHHELYRVFQQLVNTLTKTQTFNTMLHALATLTTQTVQIDLCLILLKDGDSHLLKPYASEPDLSMTGAIIQPVTISTSQWTRLRAFSLHNQLPTLSRPEIEALNPLKNVQYATLLPVPLFVGDECIGLLNCYSSQLRSFTHQDQLLLTTIANQSALAIKHRRGLAGDTFAQKTLIKTFMDDLFSGKAEVEATLYRRADFLGYDLTKPHAVTLIELSELSESDMLNTSNQATQRDKQPVLSREARFERYEAVVEAVKVRLLHEYPGSLVDERDNRLLCLFCLDTNPDVQHLNTWISQLVPQIKHEWHVSLFAGLSNLCHTLGDYQRGYAEANEALELGPYLDHERCSALFDELGVYRYIHKFSRTDTLCDQYQNAIDAVVEYDRRKKAILLDTLEVYLECGGNVARTSHQLDVHRNTLLQRLERLQKLSSLDLELLHHRLPLLVALKVYRLRLRSMSTLSTHVTL